jgi:hypothetical protein
LHLASFKHFNQLAYEHDLFWRVCKRPVFDESVKQIEPYGRVFGQKQHGTPHQMLMEKVASLNLMQWNNDISEEINVLLPEGNCETGDDAC